MNQREIGPDLNNLSEKECGPELFFGLVSPIGTKNELITDAIRDALLGFNFKTLEIKLSRLLRRFESKLKLVEKPEEQRYTSYMNAGDQLRADLNESSALALTALLEVEDYREKEHRSSLECRKQNCELTQAEASVVAADQPNEDLNNKTSFVPMYRQAFVLNSLKTKAEVDTLKSIYRSEFILIAGYGPKKERKRTLREKIANSHNSSDFDKFDIEADNLIKRDESDHKNEFGQNVRKVYPQADLIVNTAKPNEVHSAVDRFLKLLFGYSFHTPTRDEYGMFMAHSTSLRSSALGRQVGAALCDREGELLAVGCNEVPKATGGLYWEGDQDDQRDFVWGYDINDRMKRNLLENVFAALQKIEAPIPGTKSLSLADALKNLSKSANGDTGELLEFLFSVGKNELKSTEVLDIMEFNRTVHAEMAALMDACRRGISVKGATLYVTTFPCHECTRHIIAAGIRKVIYLDFYPKSRAEKLHWDSIIVESDDHDTKVSFEPFVGISPARYQKLFTALDRKDGFGNIQRFDKSSALPKGWSMPFSAMFREQAKTLTFLESLRSSGYIDLGDKREADK